MELNWTYLGFADDSPEMTGRRLKQANVITSYSIHYTKLYEAKGEHLIITGVAAGCHDCQLICLSYNFV